MKANPELSDRAVKLAESLLKLHAKLGEDDPDQHNVRFEQIALDLAKAVLASRRNR
jgi:hypothetical protein